MSEFQKIGWEQGKCEVWIRMVCMYIYSWKIKYKALALCTLYRSISHIISGSVFFQNLPEISSRNIVFFIKDLARCLNLVVTWNLGTSRETQELEKTTFKERWFLPRFELFHSVILYWCTTTIECIQCIEIEGWFILQYEVWPCCLVGFSLCCLVFQALLGFIACCSKVNYLYQSKIQLYKTICQGSRIYGSDSAGRGTCLFYVYFF